MYWDVNGVTEREKNNNNNNSPIQRLTNCTRVKGMPINFGIRKD
jgi:hypothetical protein